jgi:hypothetical protein
MPRATNDAVLADVDTIDRQRHEIERAADETTGSI